MPVQKPSSQTGLLSSERRPRKVRESRLIVVSCHYLCGGRVSRDACFFRVTTGDVDYDAVVFDVSNGESSSGVSAPPLPFLDDSVLSNVKKSLRDGG